MNRKVVLFLLIVVLGFSFLLVTTSFAEEGHHHEHHKAVEQTKQSEDFGICPVMKGEASGTYSHEYDGKIYHFCCPSCIDAFKANPEKYVSKIKEFNFEAYQFGYSPERIEVKKGDIVRLLTSSRDVPHGIYIKNYDINATVKKGDIKKIEFIADETGEFDILCSVYCGKGHHGMKAVLVVEE
ncbi:YHS domain-containing protein [Patescibacteria group bacterium]|nr:YHS domain-containing protein [Patescibacteria group bacterium]